MLEISEVAITFQQAKKQIKSIRGHQKLDFLTITNLFTVLFRIWQFRKLFKQEGYKNWICCILRTCLTFTQKNIVIFFVIFFMKCVSKILLSAFIALKYFFFVISDVELSIFKRVHYATWFKKSKRSGERWIELNLRIQLYYPALMGRLWIGDVYKAYLDVANRNKAGVCEPIWMNMNAVMTFLDYVKCPERKAHAQMLC